jgi:ABC-2 type transport system permease protein
MTRAFPYLLLPHLLASRNRARRRERGDLSRGLLFGGVALLVCGALYQGSFWLTGQLDAYAELGDYLLRIGLSWLFLTFLSFLAFSGVVTALSSFFLSDDLRLLLVAPVATRRLFHARFARTLVQSSWMVVIFVVPVLVGVGRARCAGAGYYATALLTVVPFAVIPVAIGTAVTLLLVNTFPARRARDLLMLMGLVFAASLVVVLRMIRPEQLMRVESLPDVTDFFATLQSPVTPLLPSFWAGETLFAADAICCTPARCGRRRWRRWCCCAPRANGGTSPGSADRRKRRRRASRGSARLTRSSAGCRSRRCGASCSSRTPRSSCATSASGRSCCCSSR